MDKGAFIKIGEVRIKLSNIKNYGISEKQTANKSPIGEYRRKIWLCDNVRKTFNPEWETETSFNTQYVPCFGGDRKSFLVIDDYPAWEQFIDIKALKNEYMKVKAIAVQRDEKEKLRNKKKNSFTAIFKNLLKDTGKIGEVLSEQEAVVPFYYETDKVHAGESEMDLRGPAGLVSTKGKLYFDGDTLRCEGSPFNGLRMEVERAKVCSQHRVFGEMDELIGNGELQRVDYGLTQEASTTRYLYVTTYQNDNFQFTEDQCDIDDILRRLDESLSI